MGGLGYGLFFTPVFQIKHIEVQGAQKVPAEKLQELTREHIPKKFAFLSINNLFLANVGRVAQEVQAAFPEIETVAVDTTFPDKIKVTIKERGAVAVWCQQKNFTVEVSEGEEQAARSVRECFAMDSGGVIFEQKEPEGEVVIFGGKSEAVLGEQVLAQELLSNILLFQKQMDAAALFQEVGLRVSGITVFSEDRANARISEGWEIYLNPADNIDWQTTKAKLVLDQEIPFAKRPLLEYIDLRFGDQAYIKYR